MASRRDVGRGGGDEVSRSVRKEKSKWCVGGRAGDMEGRGESSDKLARRSSESRRQASIDLETDAEEACAMKRR